MEIMDSLYRLCETLENEVERVNAKLDKSKGELTGDDLSYIQKLTHSLKSIKATIAMMEDEEGYSNRMYPMTGGSYRGGNGGSYRGGSYARGRMNARRDMGRYSRETGYSRDDGMVDELRDLMEDAPNDAVKRDIKKLIDKIEQM